MNKLYQLPFLCWCTPRIIQSYCSLEVCLYVSPGLFAICKPDDRVPKCIRMPYMCLHRDNCRIIPVLLWSSNNFVGHEWQRITTIQCSDIKTTQMLIIIWVFLMFIYRLLKYQSSLCSPWCTCLKRWLDTNSLCIFILLYVNKNSRYRRHKTENVSKRL